MYMNKELFEKAKEAYKKMKWFGIVISIVMILMGGVMFFLPETATAIVLWLMVVGLFVKGISNIVVFCKLPKGARDGWLLALGIIWTVLAGTMIVNGLFADVFESLIIWGSFETALGFVLGFSLLFDGIEMLCSTGMVKAMGGSVAVFVVGGILSILVGLICLTYPIGSVITLTILYGLFLLISGIVLLIRAITY